jgi:putative spermidine/putrescine transport system permease protein
MFAVLGRLDPSHEEAAHDLASRWRIVKDVVVPIVFPGMIAVALFGFTLSYDEFPRRALTTLIPHWVIVDEAEVDSFYEKEMPGP